MRTLTLRLEPLDVLFFRDGRPLGPSHEGRSVMPLPQTLAGALRTAWMRECDVDFEALGSKLRDRMPLHEALGEARWIADAYVGGPFLADAKRGLLLPVPALLRRTKTAGTGRLVRLAPLSRTAPGWEPLRAGLRPLWTFEREPTEPVDGFLTSQGMQALLEGAVPADEDVVPQADVLAMDRRTGIGISSDAGVVADGSIFTLGLLAPAPGVAFVAEVHLPEGTDLPRLRTLSWGGDGRRVRIQYEETPLRLPECQSSGKTCVILATPGFFKDGAWPAFVKSEDVKLAGAAVRGSVAVSGWDLARGGPKPTRWAAAAGSTWFFDDLPAETARHGQSVCDYAEDARLGWGTALRGVWHEQR